MTSFFPVTMRARFALILGVTLIPVIGSTLFSYVRERRVLSEHVNEDVMRISRTAAGIQEMAIDSSLQLLTALAASVDGDYRNSARLLRRAQNQNPVYEAIGLVLADGTLIGAAGEISAAGLVERMHEGRETAIDVREEGSGRHTGLILSRYFHLRSRESDAVLFVVLNMERLIGHADLQLPFDAEYVTITENGTVLAASSAHGNEVKRDSLLVETVLAHREGTVEAKGLDGKSRFYAFRPLSGVADTGIYIAVGFPASIYTEFDRILAIDLFILALSLLAGVIIWGLADRTLIRKVNALVVTARRLSGGEMQARTGIAYGSSGELGRIAQALDHMADSLESRTDQLYSYQERLRSMASELLLVEERERRRIASEMHDRVGQALALSKIRLAALIKAEKNSRLGQGLEGVRKYIDQAILDTRSIIYKISSPILYELGLEAALEWLVEQVQEEHGIQSSFSSDGADKPLDEDVRVLLFQSVGELLVNVVKHAGAGRVAVRCRRDGGHIHIEVEDDGRGFAPGEKSGKRRSDAGFGLFGIRERLNHVKGSMEIQSSPGNGARVILRATLKIIQPA